MAENILMLALSPTMEKGTILRWHKQEGDAIAAGDILCEVETDKTTMEYESGTEGVLLKILIPEGGEARIGQPIAVAGQPGEPVAAGTAGELHPPASAPADGTRSGSTQPPAIGSPGIAPAVPPAENAAGHVKASPLARKIATSRGLDLRIIQGSGPGGRIIKRDVEARPAPVLSSPAPFSPSPAAAGLSAPAASPGVPAASSANAGATFLPVTNKRKIIARRLTQSKFSAPHYYLRMAVQMDTILAARQTLIEKSGSKVSLNAFFLKFAAEALRRHPMVNAGWEEERIVLFPAADIALAVALPDGLITPVVRDCGRKGILAIHQELAVLIDKAKAGTLQPEEYTGAGFTISNLGSFGIEEFTAIINPPGSAILALGAITPEPVAAADGTIAIRQRLRMTLSCDHRLIDGAVGAAFLQELRRLLEDPVTALY